MPEKLAVIISGAHRIRYRSGFGLSSSNDCVVTLRAHVRICISSPIGGIYNNRREQPRAYTHRELGSVLPTR
jgi:hypothetical protein